MAVTLTPLVTEVQTRCDALTNSSTVSEIIDAAIAAKKVAMADGVVNRTVLDAQIQRIINASGSGSLIEDLIALAAANERKTSPGGSGSLPVGFQTMVSRFSPSLMTLADGSQWLKSGVLVENDDTFGEAESVPHLCVYGGAEISIGSSGYTRNDKLITDGNGIIVALGNSLRVSADGGVTWGDPNAGLPASTLLCGAWCGDRFILAYQDGGGSNTALWYSNNGIDWTKGATFSRVHGTAVSLAWNGSFAMFVACSATAFSAFRTLDGGLTVISSGSGSGTFTADSFYVKALGDDFYCFGSTAFRYDNSTNAWTSLSSSGLGSATGMAKIGSRLVALQSATGQIRYSDDNGGSWTVVSASAELAKIPITVSGLAQMGNQVYGIPAPDNTMPYLPYFDATELRWNVLHASAAIRRVYPDSGLLSYTNMNNAAPFNPNRPDYFGLATEIAPPDSNQVMAVRVK